MRALLGDSTLIQYNQTIHLGNGRQAMRNCNHGFTLHQVVQTVLNCCFDFRIQRTGRFIQNQNRRIFQEYTCNCNSLTLSAGKFHATFTDIGFIAFFATQIRQIRNKFFCFGFTHSFKHFFISRIWTTIFNVFRDSAM